MEERRDRDPMVGPGRERSYGRAYASVLVVGGEEGDWTGGRPEERDAGEGRCSVLTTEDRRSEEKIKQEALSCSVFFLVKKEQGKGYCRLAYAFTVRIVCSTSHIAAPRTDLGLGNYWLCLTVSALMMSEVIDCLLEISVIVTTSGLPKRAIGRGLGSLRLQWPDMYSRHPANMGETNLRLKPTTPGQK
jgi:hypothetical protein